ncbi:MAG: type II toxin-antitoxin system VapC family toxin [Tepidisphaeraceae bacterium]
MNFLLDTNICSAYLKGDGRVFNRFIQHAGGLSVSAIVVAELYSWVYRAKTRPDRLQGLASLLSELQLIPVDHDVARRFGELRAALLDQGRPTPEIDLLIASTALSYDLTLVTHNVQDFSHLPGLRIEDWLSA